MCKLMDNCQCKPEMIPKKLYFHKSLKIYGNKNAIYVEIYMKVIKDRGFISLYLVIHVMIFVTNLNSLNLILILICISLLLTRVFFSESLNTNNPISCVNLMGWGSIYMSNGWATLYVTYYDSVFHILHKLSV